MNPSTNLNLERLRRQLANSKNVNVLQPKPVIKKQVVKKPVVRKRKKVVSRPTTGIIIIPQKPIDNTFWNFFYALMYLVILFFIATLLYNLYVYYINSSQPIPEVTLNNTIKNNPRGVILDQKGAPISVENNFMRENRSPQCNYGQYAAYPGGFSENSGIDFNSYDQGYYSQSDDGSTKKYYTNVMNSDRNRINNYIRNQNEYIRNINNRVRQINSNRMYTPTFSRDKYVLQEIRNYERRLANQVERERKNQPYLPDQNRNYQ